MAINIPIITSLEDTGIKSAKAAFNDFKSAVGSAEGGMGKFKAGSKVALDAVKANAGNLAMAGAAAFATFAAQGIKAFQDLALGAEKFATSTGLAIEDASRYMEVAGDLAIPVDAVEGAIGRLNKTIGADPDKVRDLGVDLVYLKDGSLDVNATFLNTIERIKGIKDPAEKAKVAAQLLGKGWQSMSTLIEMGADDLSTALGNVSDSKVIDPKELEKAKNFRDTMDKLKDTVEDLSLTLGESLVPALEDIGELLDLFSDFSGALEKIPGAAWLRDHFGYFPSIQLAKDVFNGLGDAIGFVGGLFSDEAPKVEVFAEEMTLAREDTDDFKIAIKQARLDAILPFTTAVDGMSTALMTADTAWKNLTGNLEREVALDNAETDLRELEAAAAKAFGSGAQQDINDYERETLEYLTALQSISGTMDTISQKEIAFKFKMEGPAAAQEYARYLARGAEYGGLSQQDALTLAGISTLPRRAMGGPVSPGGSYIVGERGPELFMPTSSGNITPNGAMGGNTITVNVNGGDPDAVVRAIQKYARQNGAIPLQTTTSARF